MSSSVERIIPYIMENNACLKPPTSHVWNQYGPFHHPFDFPLDHNWNSELFTGWFEVSGHTCHTTTEQSWASSGSNSISISGGKWNYHFTRVLVFARVLIRCCWWLSIPSCPVSHPRFPGLVMVDNHWSSTISALNFYFARVNLHFHKPLPVSLPITCYIPHFLLSWFFKLPLTPPFPVSWTSEIWLFHILDHLSCYIRRMMGWTDEFDGKQSFSDQTFRP